MQITAAHCPAQCALSEWFLQLIQITCAWTELVKAFVKGHGHHICQLPGLPARVIESSQCVTIILIPKWQSKLKVHWCIGAATAKPSSRQVAQGEIMPGGVEGRDALCLTSQFR